MQPLHDPDAVIVPQGTLVVLCGVAGCGKSTFAARNFSATQIVSSDECREILSDDASNQRVSGKAFQLLHWITAERLRLGRTTVVDSTALTRQARKQLLRLADEHRARKTLVLFDVPLQECVDRDTARERQVGEEVIRQQYGAFLQALDAVQSELWDEIIMLRGDAIDRTRFLPQMGSFDLRYLSGPFDIIGDLHGCTDELRELLGRLGYEQTGQWSYEHAQGRLLVFLGDLSDRGPHSAEALELVMNLAQTGSALFTPGNHDNKLMRYLQGRRVHQTHGLASTVEQVEARERHERGFKERLREFLESAPAYLWLDSGGLVVAHAGIKANMIGQDNPAVRRMCLYGDITGEVHPSGKPVRLDWAEHYSGNVAIVYGHTPRPAAVWINNTVNIDQACVFGGRLTAMRWPEREAIEVRAREVYNTEERPDFLQEGPTGLPEVVFGAES